MSNDDLFDEAFRKKLEHLNFVARKIVSGLMRGQGPAAHKGSTTEFQDYRSYAPGDDFRSIDWNVYRRLGELVVKIYQPEQNVRMTLLLDASASMDFGALNKLDHAKRVAAALAYIGMANMDNVDVIPFSHVLQSGVRGLRGVGKAEALFQALRALKAEGRTDLAAAFRSFISGSRRRGLVIVVSDLYDLDRYATALKYLRARKNEVYLLHVVDREEARPDARGTTALVDRETGRHREVTLTPRLLKRYREHFATHRREVETFCRANHIGYAPARTEVPFDQLILHLLRQGGLVR